MVNTLGATVSLETCKLKPQLLISATASLSFRRCTVPAWLPWSAFTQNRLQNVKVLYVLASHTHPREHSNVLLPPNNARTLESIASK